MRVGLEKNDPVLVRLLADNIGECIDWLTDDLKIAYDAAATQYPDHSASRQIGVVGRSVSFLDQMQALLAQNHGQLFTDVRASKLLTDDNGAVIGALGTDATGKEVTFLSLIHISMMNLGDHFATPFHIQQLRRHDLCFQPVPLNQRIDLTAQHTYFNVSFFEFPFDPACALPASAGLFLFPARLFLL